MARPINRRVVLAARPRGAPTLDTFRLEEVPVPALSDGQLLLRTVYLSLDPYMRGRMYEVGPSYAGNVAVGDVMVGGTVSLVEESRHPDFDAGELVLGSAGWQTHAISSGDGLARIDDTFPRPSHALGVLGMPGFSGYVALLDIGRPQPGETVVVAAATGPVGAVVGQVAKIQGARAVGVAGGPDKCAYAVEELGLDACVDHRAPDFAARLREACPRGIDVYFENVGGKVFDAAWPLMNVHGRMPVCGVINRYNARGLPPGPDRLEHWLMGIMLRRVLVQGFAIADHEARRPAFIEDMTRWVREGRVKVREDIVHGLDRAPEAFLGMLEGKNFGKLLVQLMEP